MPINQPNSALARADRRVNDARTALHGALEMLEVAGKTSGHLGTDVRAALTSLDQAAGALNFAGNSQQRLVDAATAAGNSLRELRAETHNLHLKERAIAADSALQAAISHACGPGID